MGEAEVVTVDDEGEEEEEETSDDDLQVTILTSLSFEIIMQIDCFSPCCFHAVVTWKT